MTGWPARLYFALRGSGWFVPSATGGLFPFPFLWQGWLAAFGFVTLLLATILLPFDAGWIARIALATGYVGLGMLTYELPDRPAQ